MNTWDRLATLRLAKLAQQAEAEQWEPSRFCAEAIKLGTLGESMGEWWNRGPRAAVGGAWDTVAGPVRGAREAYRDTKATGAKGFGAVAEFAGRAAIDVPRNTLVSTLPKGESKRRLAGLARAGAGVITTPLGPVAKGLGWTGKKVSDKVKKTGPGGALTGALKVLTIAQPFQAGLGELRKAATSARKGGS